MMSCNSGGLLDMRSGVPIPSVSIIISNYNKGELVRHSLESLLRQTRDEWEAIVVDDCSSDESWAVIQDYATKDRRFVAIRNDLNKGGNFCRNLGFKMSKGVYIVFLDSDDWLSDDCLENRIREFEREENKSIDMLVFPMVSTKDGNGGKDWKYGDRKNALESFLRHEIPWSIMMPVWRRTAFERTGGFDEAFPRLQDVELHTRALLMELNYKFSERRTPDCLYFTGESRMTVNYQKAAEIFVSAVELYVNKMKRLISESQRTEIEKRHLQGALSETLLAAVSNVGNSCQAGRISPEVRMVLYGRIEAMGGFWCRQYALLYKIGINRVRGFNFLYRRIGRLLRAR